MSAANWLRMAARRALECTEGLAGILDKKYQTCSPTLADSEHIHFLYMYLCSFAWPDPILHQGKGSGTWPQSNLSPRNLISHVNPVMTSAMAIAKVRLATFLYSQFRFLLCCSSWLKTLLAQHTSHTLVKFAVYANWNLNFPVNHILKVDLSCDWILCCDWYALHGAGQQTALWPCPRPFPSVRNGSGHARLPHAPSSWNFKPAHAARKV